MGSSFHINQRLSYDDALCTIRYIGSVGTTKGEWLGVEWDDVLRGKHSGEHEGTQYFECKIPNSGSFIRPARKPDASLSFIEALRRKYTTAEDPPRKNATIALTANKVFEEVGFDKVNRKFSQLQTLKNILLDSLQIDRVDDVAIIRATCPNVEELDISRNRFEKLDDIAIICSALPNLTSLRISGNRFDTFDVSSSSGFANIKHLEISNVLMSWSEIGTLLALFPRLHTLIAPHNEFSKIPSPSPFPPTLRALDLSYNTFTAFSSVAALSSPPTLETLILAHNTISALSITDTVFPALSRLNLVYNAIPHFHHLDYLPPATPSLTSLRISHNPLYSNVTPDDAHMLTIARLAPTVHILNHSTITVKERDNAEMWYLSRVAAELAAAPAEDKDKILASHARWAELCRLHGEPRLAGAMGSAGVDRTLGVGLVEMEFSAAGGETVTRKIPRSTPVSTLRGLVARWFGMPAMEVRLVCSSAVAVHGGAGAETETETVEEGAVAVVVVLEDVSDTKNLGMYLEAKSVKVVVERM